MQKKELIEALSGLRSRGAIKKFGARVDREAPLRAALTALLEERGDSVAADAAGKRLVRAALDRSANAQTRTNPVHRDHGFRCGHCAALVPAGGRRIRDHCPQCLRSLHLDKIPGDRAADCGGLLDPIRFELRGADILVAYRCRRCAHEWRGRTHPDDVVPPSLNPADLPGPARSTQVHAVDRARTLPMRTIDAVRKYGLWAPGQRVVLAVSGGLDSTVMMELLARTARAHGGALEVVSFDHGLRPEATAEVATVGRHAAALGLPFSGVRLDIGAGSDLMARARVARRDALRATGADRIATAHHLDDQAETVLFAMLRGSGAAGLRGMARLDPPWCRPLVDESRAVLQAWAESEGLRWIEDPSNPASLRGQVRTLMPQLDALHGGAGRALARSARLLAREDHLLTLLTDERARALAHPNGVSLAALHAEHPAIQLRVLRRLTRSVAPSPTAAQLEAVLNWTPQGPSRLPLSGGWSLEHNRDRLSLRPPE